MNNSEMYNIVSESELTEVLAHFNTEFVMSIIDSAIANRHNPTAYMSYPNVVGAWNTNFNSMVQYYGSAEMTEQINKVRLDTYKEIITRICQFHGLNFTIDEVDLYTAAFYLYQVFVSNFLQYMDQFYAMYIMREVGSIYEALNLDDIRKSKDTSTTYAKRVFKDPRLAIINANIDTVVHFLEGIDISFDQIIMSCGLTPQEANLILSLVSDQDNFYRNQYVRVMMDDNVRPIRLNSIRFIIRNLAEPGDAVLASMFVQQTEELQPAPV